MDKVLTMLGDLSERMNRMDGKDHKGSPKSIFGSALGVGAGMSLQALEHTPPPQKSPNVSPATMYVHPGLQVTGMPDAQHRKLALQPFDGKELYHGLGSGFLEWGKEFVRQVGFAKCGCAWPEDIKVDVLGQHLAGKAQTYYRRQVETWWSESQTLEHAMQRLLQTFNTKTSPA
ncbi:unnamed protein product [Peronospora destructor]|uniref:Uncharacterized protein n=1 Tax=Peronospora destructor TaxID=86335 RepID=A0AAV0VD61_9STRA|nr:unnamed protein product [Peronospora destructor]